MHLTARIISLIAVLTMPAPAAWGAEFTKSVDVPGGKVKVRLLDLPSDGPATGPRANARIGVTPSIAVGAGIARALDQTGRVQVVSPARFSVVSSFDQLTRSEFNETLSESCARFKLNYALYGSSPQVGGGASLSTYFVGFGRMKMSQSSELRLYDCKSKQAVWKQQAFVESSQGNVKNIVAGGFKYGGSENDNVSGLLISEKLISDMKW